jgi:hypothetical protein
MPKVTLTIGNQESEAAFEAWIIVAANLLVGNYNVMERNSYTGLRHAWLNHVFELAGVLCEPHLEPIARAPRKQKGAATVQAPVPKKATEKQKHMKGLSRSGDQTSAQELVLAKPVKRSKKFSSQSSRLSIIEKTTSSNVKISMGKMTPTSVGGRALDLFDSGSSTSDSEAAAPIPRKKDPQKSPPLKAVIKPFDAPAAKGTSAWSFTSHLS